MEQTASEDKESSQPDKRTEHPGKATSDSQDQQLGVLQFIIRQFLDEEHDGEGEQDDASEVVSAG